MDESSVVPVTLPNGARIHVEATTLNTASDVAFFGDVTLEGLTDSIEGIASAFTETMRKVKPTKAAVEFALEIGVESGKLTALLVKGTGKANLKLTMEWTAEASKPPSKPSPEAASEAAPRAEP